MTNDKLNQLNGDSVSLKELGKLIKLVNEIKLIEGFQPIRVTASRDIFINQKPAQLLEARTINNKGFSLIIEDKGPLIETMKQVGLDVDSKKNQFKLSFTEPNKLDNKPNESLVKTSNNNNLITNIPVKKIINKHYANNIQANSNHALQSKPATNNQRIEVPVKLASKVESLSVLAKVPQSNNTLAPPIEAQKKTSEKIQLKAQIIPNTRLQQNYSALVDPAFKQKQKLNPNGKTQQIQTPIIDKPPITSQLKSEKIPSTENEISLNTKALNKKQPHTYLDVKQESKTSAQVPDRQPNQVNSDNTLPPSQVQKKTTNIQVPVGAKSQVETLLTQQKTINNDNVAQQYKVSKGGIEFILESQRPLNVGDKVQIIMDTKDNIQLLPIKKSTVISTLNAELAKSLPQQLNKNELVQLIQNLASLKPDNRVDESTQKLIQQLLTSIPNRQDLETPQALKQALSNSGLFFENKLINNPTNLSQDIKANWLNIQNSLPKSQVAEGLTPSLNKETLDPKAGLAISQAIERITSSQIRNLQEVGKFEGLNFPINIEIPIQDKGATSLFQLQIYQDKDQENQSKPAKKRKWLAKLLFDFPETGKFEARVNVEENKVSVIFVAEDKSTEHKIRQHSQKLTKQLTEKGLEVAQFDSFCKPLEKLAKQKQKRNLIDVRT